MLRTIKYCASLPLLGSKQRTRNTSTNQSKVATIFARKAHEKTLPEAKSFWSFSSKTVHFRSMSSSIKMRTPSTTQETSLEDDRLSRKSITQLSEWSKEDVVIWATENGFTTHEANILGDESETLKEYALEEMSWQALRNALASKQFSMPTRVLEAGRDKLQQLHKQFKIAMGNKTVVMPFPRDTAAYQYLKDPEQMKAALNKFKPLPGTFQDVKGYQDVEQFFISRNRFEIWQQFYSAIQSPLNKEQVVPSGPHGVGKSGIGLMIATSAYVMQKPLFYYPNCRKKLTKPNAILAFYQLNKDLIETSKTIEKVFCTLLGETSANLNQFWAEFTALPGAVLILDEHNEFYSEVYSENDENYQIYTSFQTFAATNFVMFIGSAHSKFETKIPAGYKGSLKRLPPLTFEEYKCYLEAENTPIKDLPWDSVPGSDKNEKMSYLYLHLGGLYRAVREFQKSGNFESYCAELAGTYYTRLLASMKEAADANAIKLLLTQLQNDGSVGTDLNPLTLDIYDRGLLYIDEQRNLVPVSETAKQVIELVTLGNVEPVEGGKTKAEHGQRLEKQLVAALQIFEIKTLSGFQYDLGRKHVDITESKLLVSRKVNIPPNTHIWDFSKHNVTTLLIPPAENFKAWDAIVKSPTQLCFFQSTVIESDGEKYVKFSKYQSFIHDKLEEHNNKTMLEVYAKNLYGSKATVERTMDLQYLIRVDSKEIPVRFFICHGIPKEKSIKYWYMPRTKDEPGWAALTIMPKEELVANFRIVF